MRPGYIALTEIVKVYGLSEVEINRIRNNAKNWGCEAVKIGSRLYYPENKVYMLMNGLKTWERHKKHSKTPEYTDISYCAAMMNKTNHNFYEIASRRGIRSRFVMINGCWKVKTTEVYEIMKIIDSPMLKK